MCVQQGQNPQQGPFMPYPPDAQQPGMQQPWPQQPQQQWQ